MINLEATVVLIDDPAQDTQALGLFFQREREGGGGGGVFTAIVDPILKKEIGEKFLQTFLAAITCKRMVLAGKMILPETS